MGKTSKIIIDHMIQLFDRISDPNLLVRKITIGANHILNESDVPEEVQEQRIINEQLKRGRKMSTCICYIVLRFY